MLFFVLFFVLFFGKFSFTWCRIQCKSRYLKNEKGFIMLWDCTFFQKTIGIPWTRKPRISTLIISLNILPLWVNHGGMWNVWPRQWQLFIWRTGNHATLFCIQYDIRLFRLYPAISFIYIDISSQGPLGWHMATFALIFTA